jgi:phosphoribosylpyrophosphate synthetase
VRVSKPDLIVVCDPIVRPAADALSKRWDIRIVEPTEQWFRSTGEWSVWMPVPFRHQKVLLVASMRDDVHAALFRTMMLVESLVRGGARSIELLVPLLPYARSDRRPAPHAVPGREVFLAALLNSGLRRIVTLDLHSPAPRRYRRRLKSVSPLDAMLSHLDIRGYPPSSIVLPDHGAYIRVGHRLKNAEFVLMEKRRMGDDRVSLLFAGTTSLTGNVMIIDDALFTGATHVAAVREARRLGADEVHLTVTHAMPQASTLDRLADAGLASLTHFGTTSWRGSHRLLEVRELHWAHGIAICNEAAPHDTIGIR